MKKQHKTEHERILNLESKMKQHHALIEKILEKLEPVELS